MSKKTPYRSCFVPLCPNSTVKTPDKVFLVVPQDPKLREKWCRAVRRPNPKTGKSTFFCCEDHFNLREDMANYVYYKLMGGIAKIKKDVLPHKFECQPDRKRRTCSAARAASEKRRRQIEIEKILAEANNAPSRVPDVASQQTPEDETNRGPDDIGKFYFVQCTDPSDNCGKYKDAATQTCKKDRIVNKKTNTRPHYSIDHTKCNIPESSSHKCCHPVNYNIHLDDETDPLNCPCESK